MGLEEYTEYIVAVDMRWATSGEKKLRYDSALVWDSYKEQTKWNAQLSYTVTGSTDGLYGFDRYGTCAMNGHLKEKHADTASVWQLDTNAVCPIRGGRMAALCYTCGEQEVVLILDEVEKTYTIVRGIGE